MLLRRSRGSPSEIVDRKSSKRDSGDVLIRKGGVGTETFAIRYKIYA